MVTGLNDYYDRGDAAIERFQRQISQSTSRFCAMAGSTLKHMMESVPQSCDRIVREFPKQIPGIVDFLVASFCR